MNKIAHIIAMAISITSSSVCAQAGSTDFPSLTPSEVQITNTSRQTVVNFAISGNNCTPHIVATLNPDYYGTYTCNGASAFTFSIETRMHDGSISKRSATLAPSNRYEIYADATGVWDIRQSSSR